MSIPEFSFAWNCHKERANVRKHGVEFVEAMSVLSDPLALSHRDDEYRFPEERWITIGQSDEAGILVVVHTCECIDDGRVHARIISARPATSHERREYETNPYGVQEPQALRPFKEIPMKDEYDFSGAVRGKFYREGAVFIAPVHLDTEVVARLSELACKGNVDASRLANSILRQGMAELMRD